MFDFMPLISEGGGGGGRGMCRSLRLRRLKKYEKRTLMV